MDIAVETNRKMNDFVFNHSINKEDVLALQYNALKATTDEQKAVFRDALHKKLSTLYSNLSNAGYKQLHFHFSYCPIYKLWLLMRLFYYIIIETIN